jgi:hypothetical protein
MRQNSFFLEFITSLIHLTENAQKNPTLFMKQIQKNKFVMKNKSEAANNAAPPSLTSHQ